MSVRGASQRWCVCVCVCVCMGFFLGGEFGGGVGLVLRPAERGGGGGGALVCVCVCVCVPCDHV